MRKASIFGLLLVAACAAEPTDRNSTPLFETAASTSSGPVPKPPFSEEQLENLCNHPEAELSRPPDPAGYCDIEVRLTGSTFATGQGVSEGRGEISFSATASTLNGPSQTATVSHGESTYNKGQTIGQSMDLGTYRVPIGISQHVQICVNFVEHDNGGGNGGNDTASDCTTIMLQCSAADGNGDGMPDGQHSFGTTVGPAAFCGDNVCLGSASALIEVMAADADMDGVANDDDFTPELCDELDKGELGIGALIYYHYDDPSLTNTFQAAFINIGQVFPEYDYVVLVADNETSNSMNLMAPAFSGADKLFPPTREGILDAMQDLTSAGLRFDVFTFAHGYKNGTDDADFEVLSGDNISGNWLVDATRPWEIGTAQGGVPIMAFWSTTCIAARQIDAWLEIGGISASGTKDVEFRPNAWDPFFDDWKNGIAYRQAVEDSHTAWVIWSSEVAIREMGKQDPYLCKKDNPDTEELDDGPGVVTGLNACAEDFFNDDVGPNEARYNIWEVYDHSVSGAVNMAISSTREFVGDDNLTFGAPGHQWP